MDSSNFPTGTPLIYLSMMIQGDGGYGEMAIVMMMAIVMTMKKRLQLVGRLGNSQCLPLVFTGLHRWCNETTTVSGEDGETTTTGMLLEPLVRLYRR